MRLLISLLLLFSMDAAAQETPTDTIVARMARYHAVMPNRSLFVHFDKTVYTANEVSWFTAYLLRQAPHTVHRVLAVALVSAYDRKIVAQRQFTMRNGLATGDIRLPDSIPPGRYLFICYTEVMRGGEPDQLFTQAITVKTARETPFTASLQLIDTTASEGFYRVKLEGFTKEHTLLAGASLRWRAAPGKPLLTGKTDQRGEYEFKIAQRDVDPANPLFETEITAKNGTAKLRLRLPVKEVKPIVQVLPEGGYLVEDAMANVAVEALSPAGAPILGQVDIYENDTLQQSMSTDSYGTCRFVLTPKPGSRYTAKVLGFEYPFPQAMRSGPVIALRRAVVDDSLYVVLMDKRFEKLQLIVHDYERVFLSMDINAKDVIILKLSLANVPRGLMSFTVLDDEGKPYIERLFFAHYQQGPSLKLTPGKEEYEQREKVSVSLDLTDDLGKPLRGIVSIACIQDNRIETVNRSDIETFAYLQSRLRDLPPDPTAQGFRNRDYLENMLFVKGWRKYSWREMMNTDLADTARTPFVKLGFGGQVTRFNKPLKKPALVGVVSPRGFITLTTDATGSFTVDNDDMVLYPDQKAMMMVMGRDQDVSHVTLINPYETQNAHLSATINAGVLEERAESPKTNSLQLPRTESAIALDEVKLVNKRDNSLYERSGPGGLQANACGDYVCRFNILNCPNHFNDPGNRAPVRGQTYNVPGRSSQVYMGCSEEQQEQKRFISSYPGIYLSKEFYGSDYSVFSPPEPEYFSTIYWQHAAVPDASGKATISFYTSDITGKFTIIAQGITGHDVVYAEKSFMVKKKSRP